MRQDRQLRAHLIAMLVGAAFLVLGVLGSWPPETGLERALTGLTVAVVVIAVLRPRRAGLGVGPARSDAPGPQPVCSAVYGLFHARSLPQAVATAHAGLQGLC
jgi:hypothetical protein